MALISKTIKVRVNNSNIKHFSSKGYNNLKINKLITIPVGYLTKGSGVKVKIKCDDCGISKKIHYQAYIINIERKGSNGLYTCSSKCGSFKSKGKRKRNYLDKSILVDLYINKKMSINEISNYLKVKFHLVYSSLRKYNLNRTIKEGNNLKKHFRKINLEQFKEQIIDLYVNKLKSGNFIGEKYDVTKQVIIRRLKEWGVKTRLNNKKQLLDKKILIDLYEEKNLSIKEISKITNKGEWVVRKSLKKYGLNRSRSEAIKRAMKINEPYQKITLSEKKLEKIKFLYMNKLFSAAEISKKIGYSISFITKQLKELGICRTTSEANIIKKEKGITIWNKGKKLSNETIKKLRLLHIERIKKSIKNGNQIYPFYNSKSIPIIEEYGKKYDYKFQHAENGGEHYIKELGYWVDGYDKNKNVVVEYDEKHHFNSNGTLKEKDIRRQKEIEEFLGCKFIRIKENKLWH